MTGHGLPTAPVVLVTVGTDHHPFDRLVAWVDGWFADTTVDVHCMVQYGHSAPPRWAEGVSLFTYPELQRWLRAADVVVCHGGPATITEARKEGHLPVCVPRQPERGEHVDGHQVRFARRIAGDGLVVLAESEFALRGALDRAVIDPARSRRPVGLLERRTAAEPVRRVGALITTLIEQHPRPGRGAFGPLIPRQRRRRAR